MAISHEEAEEKANAICKYIENVDCVASEKCPQSQDDATKFLESLGLPRKPNGLFTLYAQPMIGREVLVDPTRVYEFRSKTEHGKKSSTKVFLYQEANGNVSEAVNGKRVSGVIKRCDKFELKKKNSLDSYLKLCTQVKPDDSELRVYVVLHNLCNDGEIRGELPIRNFDFSSCDFHKILLDVGLVREIPIPEHIAELWNGYEFVGMKREDMKLFPLHARPVPGAYDIADSKLIHGTMNNFAYVITDSAGVPHLWKICDLAFWNWL